MRINVYTEELLTANDPLPFAEIVTADYISSRTGEQMTNYGLRIFLKSPPELHYIPGRDDDRSAVTFWCGPSKKNVFVFLDIIHTFAKDSELKLWRKKTLAANEEAVEVECLRNTPDIEGPRHKDDSGRMIPCLDYHDGKCQSLTHYCMDCPDREQDTFGGFRPQSQPDHMK